MRAQVATAALVSLLLVATVLLGITFEGGGPSGGSSASGATGTTGVQTDTRTGKSTSAPHLVLRAQIVSPRFLEESAQYTKALPPGSTDFLVPIPQTMLTPLTGTKFVLTSVQPPSPRPERPPTFNVYTNSSGLASSYLPVGNYTVQSSGEVFNFTGSLSLASNATTYLGVVVYPRFTNVTSVEVVNHDGITQVEPSGTVYLEVPGPFRYLPGSVYQLVEQGQEILQGGGTITGVITGAYPAPNGTRVVMDPRGSFQAIPTLPTLLMQYVASAVVFQTSGNNLVYLHVA